MTTIDFNTASAVARVARTSPNAVALVYEDRSITYCELVEQASRTATVLSEDGVREGDRVAYTGFNSPAFLITFLAANSLGAVFVPVNFRLTELEVAALLADAGAHVVVSEPGHVPVVDGVADATHLNRFIVVDDDPAAPLVEPVGPRWSRLSERIAAVQPSGPPRRRAENDLALLIYTSGTTGRAKGVMLTHGNIWWNGTNVDSVVDTHTGNVNLAVAPMFHIGGLNAFTLRSLAGGGTTVLRRTFDPRRALEDLVHYRVSTFFAVPAMFAAMSRVDGFDDADLSGLHAAVVAGAPVPPGLIRQYAARGIELQQAWGLTETAPFATYLPPELTETKCGSAGLPMPYTEIRLVDAVTTAPIETHSTLGEVWVRGPNVAAGYWQNASASAEAFVGDGWFRSGDIGYLDADGYLYIADRLKDMIISGGENVYPAEVEAVLTEHPNLLEVAVVGTTDEQWGETVVAVVVSDGSHAPSLDEIQEFAGQSLARYKLPRRVVHIDTMPRNASGKLDKKGVRALVRDMDSSTASTLTSLATS
ncbi:acyl-CoA synthetase [Rhodococcus erythropolis]|uniref:acyl-CoA synthetase n=1 Tax=Rhodococcus erythropolis TaxID=1833 RepID=UPI0027DE23FE|nr:long-chain fatty acid--CoA ligase [Rhodococcus erythropolis]